MTETPPEGLPSHDDLDRVLQALNKHGAEFMVVGGFAVVYHGLVRNTRDLDLFVRPTPENARRVIAALNEAGFSSPDLRIEVFTEENGISLGEEPVRVDLLSRLPGVQFDEAWSRREVSVFGPEPASYISREDLIRNKRAVGRPRDLDDVAALEAGKGNPDAGSN